MKLKLTNQHKPMPSDPDYFSPSSNVRVVIDRDAHGFFAQARRGDHQGPVLLRQPCLRGMKVALYKLGWDPESIEQVTPIPLEELEAVYAGEVAERFQETPAITIEDFEGKMGRSYIFGAEASADIHAAFETLRQSLDTKKLVYYPVDSYVNQLKCQNMIEEFSLTDICKLKHSCVYSKGMKFNLALESEIAPLVMDRIRLSAWHNHYHTLKWAEMVQVYNSLRTFSVGLADFSVAFDHTTGCNPKGYTRNYLKESTDHPRLFIDGELALIVSYKGSPVLVMSFNVSRPTRNAAPAIYIRQIQMMKKTGNRWLFKLPCHYMEFFAMRMRAAFPHNEIFLIRGDVLGNEILDGYVKLLQRTEETLKEDRQFSAAYRASEEAEAQHLREKIQAMKTEVIERMRRNYGKRSCSGRFTRRRKGDYFHLKFVPSDRVLNIGEEEMVAC